jgi:hypothetical protein
LNASLRRKFEDMEKTLKQIISSSRDGIPIIVEGRRDREALRRLKIPGIVVCLKSSGNRFYDFTANLADKREVKVNVAIWKKLKALCRSEVRAIEELAGLVENLREESRKG